jgi:hypothetical protein
MKSDTLIQGLKRVSPFRPVVISFKSLDCITSLGHAIWQVINFPRLRRTSGVQVSAAALGWPQLTATNCERHEKASTGNRLTIVGTWVAPLIAWLIAVGMSLAIAAVALLNTE